MRPRRCPLIPFLGAFLITSPASFNPSPLVFLSFHAPHMHTQARQIEIVSPRVAKDLVCHLGKLLIVALSLTSRRFHFTLLSQFLVASDFHPIGTCSLSSRSLIHSLTYCSESVDSGLLRYLFCFSFSQVTNFKLAGFPGHSLSFGIQNPRTSTFFFSPSFLFIQRRHLETWKFHPSVLIYAETLKPELVQTAIFNLCFAHPLLTATNQSHLSTTSG
ncbi:hypothetical protein F4782DRAFT_507523 [Xylaria castorea]|nr:hypothetical protein F4782DRAFT_507523 [Xylaria castorea]